MGIEIRIVEYEAGARDGGFIEYAGPWEERSALEILRTASLCVAGSIDLDGDAGDRNRERRDEREVVRDLITWAAITSGDLDGPQPLRLRRLERALRCVVASRLNRPDLTRARQQLASRLVGFGAIDSGLLELIVAPSCERGRGRHERLFEAMVRDIARGGAIANTIGNLLHPFRLARSE